MSSQISQPYDTTLKTWVEEQPQEILPELLPGAVYQQTLNVEVFRPPLRTDKVFSVKYLEQDHILHIEFESGADNKGERHVFAHKLGRGPIHCALC